jgi:hypothetical protein
VDSNKAVISRHKCSSSSSSFFKFFILLIWPFGGGRTTPRALGWFGHPQLARRHPYSKIWWLATSCGQDGLFFLDLFLIFLIILFLIYF